MTDKPDNAPPPTAAKSALAWAKPLVDEAIAQADRGERLAPEVFAARQAARVEGRAG